MRKYLLSGITSLLMTALTFALIPLSVMTWANAPADVQSANDTAE